MIGSLVCSARRASSISEHRWRRRRFGLQRRERVAEDRGIDDGSLTICRPRHPILCSGEEQGATPAESSLFKRVVAPDQPQS
jgi:hypothetical protein